MYMPTATLAPGDRPKISSGGRAGSGELRRGPGTTPAAAPRSTMMAAAWAGVGVSARGGNSGTPLRRRRADRPSAERLGALGRGGARVDDLDARHQVERHLVAQLLDLGGAAEQDRARGAGLDDLLHGAEQTGVGGVREHDAPRVALGFLGDRAHDRVGGVG